MSATTSIAENTLLTARRTPDSAISSRRTVASGRRTEILTTAATLFATSGLRTSLKDVADACGILPGSLYHHFDSKDALLIELVERYQVELDAVAQDAVEKLRDPRPVPVDERIVDFGRAIAACAVRHRAAVMLTFYEPSIGASYDFVSVARRTPTVVHQAMLELLELGRAAGAIRSNVEVRLLSERLCQSMLHHGVGNWYRGAEVDVVPELRCRILLHGLAQESPLRSELDRSPALTRARETIAVWEGEVSNDRVAAVLASARAEFGRRGYEPTGMRDIAAAAGVAIPVLYRHFRSKEEILVSVMRPYAEKQRTAWRAVLGSSSSALEKLDALAWINITLLDQFNDEFHIQLDWLRQSPPNIRKLGSTTDQRRGIAALLASERRAGGVRFDFGHGSAETKARCIYEALWTPENVVTAAGPDGAHDFTRETLLQGALAPDYLRVN